MAQITKQQVFEAADALAESGEKITQQKIRDMIGGGSFTTIGPMLAEWQDARAEVQKVRAVPLPDAVQVVLDDAANRLWKAASDAAALGVEAARQEVDALKAKAATEVQEAREVIAVVESERDTATADAEKHRLDAEQAREVAAREVEARHALEVAKVAAEVRADAAERAAKVAEAAKAEADSRTVAALAERDAARRETEEVRNAGVEAVHRERVRGQDAMREASREHEQEMADAREEAASLRSSLSTRDAELMEHKRLLDEAKAKAKAPRKAPRAAVKPKATGQGRI